MHDKYGKDGLVVYSVVLDDPKDAANRKVGQNYLAKVKVPFPVVYLDLPPAEWSKRLRLDSYPGVFVFNADNKYVQKQPVVNAKGETEDVDYDRIEAAVRSLLKK
jgi:hypothetical protein